MRAATPKRNPFAYGKPITLDTLGDLFAHHATLTGGWTMTAGPAAPEPSAPSGAPAQPPTPTPAPTPPPAGKTYTADQLTQAIEARVGELTRKHQQELEQAKSDATKSDTQRLEAERDRANERAEAAAKKAAPKVAAALAQVAAIAAGGRPDRAEAIVKQADLDGVAKFDGDDFAVDTARLDEAIGKVLEAYPEWKAEAPKEEKKGGDQGQEQPGQQQRQRSGTELGGGSTGGEVSLDQFKRMGMAERSKLKAEDPETYRRLADAEIDARR